MATKTAKRPARKPAARSAGKATGNGKGPARTARKAARATREVVQEAGPHPTAGKLARKAAFKGMKALAKRMAGSGAQVFRSALEGVAEQSAGAGRRALEAGLSRRLPIQVSIDVAVPVSFAWDEWMRFESLHEGVDRVEEVERDGDVLFGRIAGPRARDWEAEVLDERPLEGFAWRSVEGSDCAGLVTFHELSDRLTRIEVDLDVLPTGPGQALLFASHLAHRRAEAELRRFKARLEFISPDVYAEEQDTAADDDEEAGEDAGEDALTDDDGTESN